MAVQHGGAHGKMSTQAMPVEERGRPLPRWPRSARPGELAGSTRLERQAEVLGVEVRRLEVQARVAQLDGPERRTDVLATRGRTCSCMSGITMAMVDLSV
ncbi:MAG: hypothetical protein U0P45_10450 [Acidimicrobiales bacterium]